MTVQEQIAELTARVERLEAWHAEHRPDDDEAAVAEMEAAFDAEHARLLADPAAVAERVQQPAEKPAHTPTPYHVGESGVQIFAREGAVKVAIIANDLPIAERFATARFIVTSCNCHDELLAAAKLSLSRIESDIESDRHKTPEGDALRAIIGRAEKGGLHRNYGPTTHGERERNARGQLTDKGMIEFMP